MKIDVVSPNKNNTPVEYLKVIKEECPYYDTCSVYLLDQNTVAKIYPDFYAFFGNSYKKHFEILMKETNESFVFPTDFLFDQYDRIIGNIYPFVEGIMPNVIFNQLKKSKELTMMDLIIDDLIEEFPKFYQNTEKLIAGNRVFPYDLMPHNLLISDKIKVIDTDTYKTGYGTYFSNDNLRYDAFYFNYAFIRKLIINLDVYEQQLLDIFKSDDLNKCLEQKTSDITVVFKQLKNIAQDKSKKEIKNLEDLKKFVSKESIRMRR